MLKLTIITVEKPSASHLNAVLQDYIARLAPYCKLTPINISPAHLPENPSEAEITKALGVEAKQISKHLSGFSVALCIEGKQQTSEQFAALLKTAADNHSKLTFIIGSSYGLSEAVKQKANLRLSMSAMTFPHKLAKVMLLEQVYRGFTILQGKTYHK